MTWGGGLNPRNASEKASAIPSNGFENNSAILADTEHKWIVNRRHENVAELLQGFTGILQSDGYAAYKKHADATEGITLAGCWSHAFRKFRDALSEEPVRAREVMTLIGKLYELEEQWDSDQVDETSRKHYRLLPVF